MECPSCALELEKPEDVCPYCGYEFPEPDKKLGWAAIVFILLMILPIACFVF